MEQSQLAHDGNLAVLLLGTVAGTELNVVNPAAN